MGKTYDVLVIGAGVLGATVAMHLAKNGKKVLLLEKAEVASGASGGNLGQLSISDRCTEPWHMKLAMESLAYYREILSKESEIEFNASGGSSLLSGEEELCAGEVAAQQLKEYGIEARMYYGADMTKVEPAVSAKEGDALLYCPLEGKVNPLLATLALLKKAERYGVEVKEHCPVHGFDIEEGKIKSVLTSSGKFEANIVVNCAGPRAGIVGEMAGVPVPVRYHKGTAFATQPLAPILNGPICEGRFLVKTKTKVPKPQRMIGLGTVQTADGSILIAQSTEVCDVDDIQVNSASLQLVTQKFLHYFPNLQDVQVVRAWAAATSYTPDGLPVFGFSQAVENFFTVAGFKGAFTVAPEVGRLAAVAIQGNEVPLLSGFDPDRIV